MNGKLDQRFAHGGPMKALEQRRVAEWLQAVNRPFEPSGLRREARRRAEAEADRREWRRMRRFFALLCGTVGVVLMLAGWGGCSLALGMALVLAGAALWR